MKQYEKHNDANLLSLNDSISGIVRFERIKNKNKNESVLEFFWVKYEPN